MKRLLLLIAALPFASCGAYVALQYEPGSYDLQYQLENGADCAKLFEVRNDNPGSPELEEWYSEQLRSVGCFTSSSERTD